MGTFQRGVVADRRHVVCNDPPQAAGRLEDALRQSDVPIEDLIPHPVGSQSRVLQGCFEREREDVPP